MPDTRESSQMPEPAVPASRPEPPQAPVVPPMKGLKPRQAPRWVVISAALVLMAGGLGLAGLSAWQAFNPPKPKTALEILEAVRAKVIPAEGSDAGYGVTFSKAGYDQLVAWYGQYPVNPAWAADYEALDITLSCCDASHPYADETKNCGCGHHQALYGLAKKLLTEGQGRAAVQAEIGRWKAYTFPKETLLAEMQKRAVDDPAVSQALQERIEKGEC